LIKEDTQSKLPDTPEKSDFKEYLLSEYSNIAQAHFKTIDTISTFFRNYLVIVSIPISLIAVLVSIFSGSETIETILSIRIPLSVILLAVSLARCRRFIVHGKSQNGCDSLCKDNKWYTQVFL